MDNTISSAATGDFAVDHEDRSSGLIPIDPKPPIKEIPSELYEISKQICNQDGAFTAYPIYIVYEKKEVPTASEYSDESRWYDHENGTSCEEEDVKSTIEKRLEEEEDWYERHKDDIVESKLLIFLRHWKNEEIDDEEVMEGLNYERVYFREVDKFVNIFFTDKAANAFIERHKHNLNKPFVYVESLYRNPEMRDIRSFLIRLTDPDYNGRE